MRILFTGLTCPHPLPEGSLHVPFIHVQPCIAPQVTYACQALHCYTDLLFTSKTAVHFFLQQFQSLPKELPTLYTVGKATASTLTLHGYPVAHIAAEETAEGVVAMLQENLSALAHLFWPHSAQARPVLKNYLAKAPYRSTEIDLYQTLKRCPDLLPDLSDFEGILFTSTSTVESFFACYKEVPRGVKLFAIGPVTAAAITKQGHLANRADLLHVSSSSF